MADPRIQHLLRRAGFGAGADDLTAFGDLSYGSAVARLVNYESIPDDVDGKIGQPGYVGMTSNGPFSPNTVINDARQRWLFRMLHSARPLQEKMTLFWHNYFATGYTKLAGALQAPNAARVMAAKPSEDPAGQQGQIELFRENALGAVSNLLVAVAQDPAMLVWLDGNTNTKAKPQENFGRELMELFTRGVGFYTEDDVYAAARVFTGWNLLGDGRTTTGAFKFVYNVNAHETSAKTFSFPIYPDGGRTIPARSGKSSSILRIRISLLSPRSDTLTAQTPSAAFFARSMAARRGRKFSTRTRTQGRSMWRSIRIIRIFCSPHCGRCGACRGTWQAGDQAAVCTGPMMAARRGSVLRRRACPRGRTEESACRWQRTPIASSR